MTNCTAILVSSLLNMILRRDEFSMLRKCELIPLTIDELNKTLVTLSECGELLYLKEPQNIMKRWIILKPSILLSKINGTIFASPNSLTIFGETGIVPMSKIKKLFKYQYRMIVNLMTHLELCHEISKEEVLLINKCIFSSVDPEYPEVYFFFPALVHKEKPEESCKSMLKTHYKCGWCLQCEQDDESCKDMFLSPRFLHVLLLRLTLLYGQNHGTESSTHPECTVWKNGIHWQNTDGVTAIVEVVEQNTAVVMVMGCLEGKEMECVKHRSELIKMILQTKEQYSRAVQMNESIIHPEELSTYPLSRSDSILRFNVSRIRKMISDGKEVVTCKVGLRLGMIEFDKLLHFEPWASLSPEIVSKLQNEAQADKEITIDFILDCARVAHPSMAHFKEILVSRDLEGEFIQSIEITGKSNDPINVCRHVFETWYKSAKNATFRELREHIDKYSIFQGRNPLLN